jgi:hypothetical protein
VDKKLISKSDFMRYKNILEITNADLVCHETGDDIQISGGPKFENVISKLFPQRSRIKTTLCVVPDGGGWQAVLRLCKTASHLDLG